MPTTYTNAVNVLQMTTSLDAEQLGYVDTALRGTSIVKAVSTVPPSKFMQDEYYERVLPGTSQVQTRTINQDPDSTAINRYKKQQTRTILFATKAQIDRKELEHKPNELDRRINDSLADIGYKADYMFINGNPDTAAAGTQEFFGLKALCTGTQLLNNGGGTLDIAASLANFNLFRSLCRKAKRRIKVAPDMQLAWLVNESVLEAIYAGRDLAGANTLGTSYFDLLNQDLETLEQIPLVMLRGDDIGNEILPTTETSSSSSMYLVGLGGAPAPESQEIPNGIVGLHEGGIAMTPEVRGNQRIVTSDWEYGIRVPYRSCARINLLLGK